MDWPPPTSFPSMMEALVCLLVVEDDEALCRSMVRFFNRHGFAVHPFGTKTDALALLSDGAVEAAIVDVHLPDGSGLDVLEFLRNQSTTMPVIVITADDRAAVRERANQLGASAFLPKPVQPEELLSILQQVLGRWG